jgi:hypothetical protein
MRPRVDPRSPQRHCSVGDKRILRERLLQHTSSSTSKLPESSFLNNEGGIEYGDWSSTEVLMHFAMTNLAIHHCTPARENEVCIK